MSVKSEIGLNVQNIASAGYKKGIDFTKDKINKIIIKREENIFSAVKILVVTNSTEHSTDFMNCLFSRKYVQIDDDKAFVEPLVYIKTNTVTFDIFNNDFEEYISKTNSIIEYDNYDLIYFFNTFNKQTDANLFANLKHIKKQFSKNAVVYIHNLSGLALLTPNNKNSESFYRIYEDRQEKYNPKLLEILLKTSISVLKKLETQNSLAKTQIISDNFRAKQVTKLIFSRYVNTGFLSNFFSNKANDNEILNEASSVLIKQVISIFGLENTFDTNKIELKIGDVLISTKNVILSMFIYNTRDLKIFSKVKILKYVVNILNIPENLINTLIGIISLLISGQVISEWCSNNSNKLFAGKEVDYAIDLNRYINKRNIIKYYRYSRISIKRSRNEMFKNYISSLDRIKTFFGKSERNKYKMTSQQILLLISYFLKNRDLINSEAFEKGLITLPSRFVNEALKSILLKKQKNLEDYNVKFENGKIIISLKLKFLMFNDWLVFEINIVESKLFEDTYFIKAKYEQINEGKFILNNLLKNGLKNSLKPKLNEPSLVEEFTVDTIKLNFMQWDYFRNLYEDEKSLVHNLLSSINLEYYNCENGSLNLKFNCNAI